MVLVGSFSNDDGDKDIKKAIGLLIKAALFLLHDFDVKMPNFTFYGGRKLLFLFLKLRAVPKKSTPKKIRLHLTFSSNWNKHNNVCKNANSF